MDGNYKNDNRANSSVVVTKNAVIFLGECLITDTYLTPGADTATMTIYDGVDSTGELRMKMSGVANNSRGHNFRVPIRINKACYVALTGTAPTAIIGFEIIPTHSKSE